MTVNLPSSGKANNFAWTTSLQITRDEKGGSHASRTFTWNNKVYAVTVHNPGNTLSLDQMSQAINDQIDKIVILTERYLHRNTVESFECNAQLNELKRIKTGDKGAKIQMPAVQNPLDALNTRKKAHAATDPVPPHIKNALALYDQLQKKAAPAAAPIQADQAEIKVEKQPESTEDMTLNEKKEKKKEDPKPKPVVSLGPFGYLYSCLLPGLKVVYNKVLQPVGNFLYKIGNAIREKIFGKETVAPAAVKEGETPDPEELKKLLADLAKEKEETAKAKTS